LGRPIELVISDTGGDPTTCVRKAQEAVERDGCHLLSGMTLSSEALRWYRNLASGTRFSFPRTMAMGG